MKLKQQAGAHGISMEEEHRRILRNSLLGNARKRISFKDALLAMPNAGEDADFERDAQAATALVHNLALISRDEQGFRNTGVILINLFSKSKIKGG